MKKIIYIILLTLSSAFVFTACTEENVKPNASPASSGGGNVSNPI